MTYRYTNDEPAYEVGSNYDRNREVSEARAAGQRALASLEEAYDELDSASSWGIFDMLGGSFLSGMMKHSHLDDARDALEQARYDLSVFARELGDVRDFTAPEVDVSEFLTFADFFFDGFFADMMVQSKISDAKREVKDAMRQAKRTLEALR